MATDNIEAERVKKEQAELNKPENKFASFINRDWDLYLTFTLRAPVKTINIVEDEKPRDVKDERPRDVVVWRNDVVSLKKELQFFFSNLNGYATFYEKYINVFVCFDRACEGGRIHIHALLERIPPQYCRALQSEASWFFGMSKVTPYDPQGKARHYFGNKYVYSKFADFDFMRINSRARKRPVVEWEILT